MRTDRGLRAVSDGFFTLAGVDVVRSEGALKFELFVAARYLRAKRRQAVIGLVTVISIIGVVAGVASLIVALSINAGFREDLQNRLLGSTAHISLEHASDNTIRDWRTVLGKVEHEPHVVSAAPALYEKVLVSRGARATGLLLKGIVPRYEKHVSDLLKTVTTGSVEPLEASADFMQGAQPELSSQDTKSSKFSSSALGSPLSNDSTPESGVRSSRQKQTTPNTFPPIIIGMDAADSIGATVGSVVLVTSPQGDLTPFGFVPKYMRFTVVGLFKSGFYDYDSSWGLIRLRDAQVLFGLGDVISVIELRVDDLYKAPQIAMQLEHAVGSGFMSSNWEEQNRALFKALRLEGVVTFITIALIVLVAALNILACLTMMVMEKSRDIAVLLSMGTRRKQVRQIFIYQGLLIGVTGTVIGLSLGYLLAYIGGHYHLIRLSAEVYSLDYVPFAPKAVHGLVVALTAISISLLATLYPSWSAARILPAEALRYE